MTKLLLLLFQTETWLYKNYGQHPAFRFLTLRQCISPIKNVPAQRPSSQGNIHRQHQDGSRTTSDLPCSGAPLIWRVPKTMFGCSDRVAVQNFDSVAWQPIGQICLAEIQFSIRLAVSNASAFDADESYRRKSLKRQFLGWSLISRMHGWTIQTTSRHQIDDCSKLRVYWVWHYFQTSHQSVEQRTFSKSPRTMTETGSLAQSASKYLT